MATETLTLAMKFGAADDKKKTVSLQSVRDDITATEAKDAMDVIIASDAFNYEPNEKLGAAITSRSVKTLF
ncbi:MAG: DUF2922 domain-containing protein [Synergistaceae bacterium]|jgi:hypothetical protein|nr:DUF2922 domain-containing protein [Synergistaceae bacterium]MDR1515506.1 DUF2922 domain-containing protein [Synergistaceae bacterium]